MSEPSTAHFLSLPQLKQWVSRKEDHEIASLWRESRSVSRTAAARLEAMIAAFLLPMRVIVDAVESVQKFWDSADLAALMAAAENTEALDSGGTITKASVYKYQYLFLSFKIWLNTPVSVTIGESTVDLTETPAQLIMRQPEKVEIV
jgi:hypothetical protein